MNFVLYIFLPDIEITPFIRLTFLSNKRGSLHSEAAFFYIFFTANGKFKKMRVRFTEKRYKEFLAFVPEGKETDPMTSDYQIRWRSAMRSYGKSRDDFDEW